MTRQSLRAALRTATEYLADSGVPSPAADAELLAAHVLNTTRTRLGLTPFLSEEQSVQFSAFVARRAKREPLQYITGIASMGEIDVAVGPGVFIPRPETELLLGWVLSYMQAHGLHTPRVVDLCSGSGALAFAIAHARPDAEVHAVERNPAALKWLEHNHVRRVRAGDPAVAIHAADVTEPQLLQDLSGTVDVIVANPPYVPLAAPVTAEVAEFEPADAVFSGVDGLGVIRPMVSVIARLLRQSGAAAIEHDDSNGAEVCGLLAASGSFTDVTQHADLAEKPRYVTAVRA
ncbi:peptide chain release factor N(5)-glutamine methyltransferase [Hoyosella sp. YIM 151337]|uniref:peptide chain release factor N(5)-glutamine methyltransferase n=1 Tax=Hoyosella sp. YIM 151337 TaxID=2992742 RepID=UPI00223594E9|nr:peptide chain release factor N(5)-glutamine methyltransferase [Hoyosella sp. YIM 151337]MCW4355175.1 peptide chain release factor N(5)-glutamine methyltransferase [Hoyosella sp. YIM 151337]